MSGRSEGSVGVLTATRVPQPPFSGPPPHPPPDGASRAGPLTASHPEVREDPAFLSQPGPACPRPSALTTLSAPQWRAFLPGLKFEVIGSAHVSLYTGVGLVPLWEWGGLLTGGLCGWGGIGALLGTPRTPLSPDESALKMDHVAHVPQSPASHVGGHLRLEEPRADMLRPDPRDTFFLSELGPGGGGRGPRPALCDHPPCSSSRGARQSGGRAGALRLRPHLRGQGLPNRQIPGTAVRKCPGPSLPVP